MVFNLFRTRETKEERCERIIRNGDCGVKHVLDKDQVMANLKINNLSFPVACLRCGETRTIDEWRRP